MTMKEIRKEFERRAESYTNMIGEDLGEWMKWMGFQFDVLYNEGVIKHYSNEFLREANSYAYHGGEIKVTDCLDLHYITATKTNARKFAEWFLRQ